VFPDDELDRLRGFPKIGRDELFRFFTLTPADVAGSTLRDGHLLYPVRVPEAAGWWIDAQQTLDALSLSVGSGLAPLAGRHDVDKGVLFSPDREVTTRLAEWMREQILDDGSEPLGIRFQSRVADGTCWAMWMRRADAGLGCDPVEAEPGVEIAPGDPVMKQVTQAYRIRSW
jgi:hypothetical protein